MVRTWGSRLAGMPGSCEPASFAGRSANGVIPSAARNLGARWNPVQRPTPRQDPSSLMLLPRTRPHMASVEPRKPGTGSGFRPCADLGLRAPPVDALGMTSLLMLCFGSRGRSGTETMGTEPVAAGVRSDPVARAGNVLSPPRRVGGAVSRSASAGALGAPMAPLRKRRCRYRPRPARGPSTVGAAVHIRDRPLRSAPSARAQQAAPLHGDCDVKVRVWLCVVRPTVQHHRRPTADPGRLRAAAYSFGASSPFTEGSRLPSGMNLWKCMSSTTILIFATRTFRSGFAEPRPQPRT